MANIYAMSDLWNDNGTTFTAIKMDVTDTDSASGSLLMDLQVGGTSAFKIGKGTGSIAFEQGSAAGRTKLTLPQYSEIAPANGRIGISAAGNMRIWLEEGVTVYGNGRIGFSSGTLSVGVSAATDVTLRRDGAGILAQREGTNAQTFNIYNTYTDASNYERGFMKWVSNTLQIGAEAAGTGTNRKIEFATGGATRFTISSSSNQIVFNSSGRITRQESFGGILFNADNSLTFGSGVQSDFQTGWLQFSERGSAPTAPAADNVRIYAEDDGAGKTRLMALFPTGAAQQIAIEP